MNKDQIEQWAIEAGLYDAESRVWALTPRHLPRFAELAQAAERAKWDEACEWVGRCLRGADAYEASLEIADRARGEKQ